MLTNFVLAYVNDPTRSAELYGRLFGLEPVEASPNFVMFVLPNGFKLGLWARHEVEPVAGARGGDVELAFAVADEEAVRATVREWQKLGLAILQPPTNLDFGYTATFADPDGHRLRVYAPSEIAVHSRADIQN
jgi:catechol 2,3-dioxygenase-like lactoylglutathione lyase family enzyme